MRTAQYAAEEAKISCLFALVDVPNMMEKAPVKMIINPMAGPLEIWPACEMIQVGTVRYTKSNIEMSTVVNVFVRPALT